MLKMRVGVEFKVTESCQKIALQRICNYLDRCLIVSEMYLLSDSDVEIMQPWCRLLIAKRELFFRQ